MATSTPKRCVVAGCDKPRALNRHGQPAPYLTKCVDHMQQYWREKESANYVPASAAPKPNYCCVSGCVNTRHTSDKGHRYCRCIDHLHEQWRNNKSDSPMPTERRAPSPRTKPAPKASKPKPVRPYTPPAEVIETLRQMETRVAIVSRITPFKRSTDE